jgi:hypothetical protein
VLDNEEYRPIGSVRVLAPLDADEWASSCETFDPYCLGIHDQGRAKHQRPETTDVKKHFTVFIIVTV